MSAEGVFEIVADDHVPALFKALVQATAFFDRYDLIPHAVVQLHAPGQVLAEVQGRGNQQPLADFAQAHPAFEMFPDPIGGNIVKRAARLAVREHLAQGIGQRAAGQHVGRAENIDDAVEAVIAQTERQRDPAAPTEAPGGHAIGLHAAVILQNPADQRHDIVNVTVDQAEFAGALVAALCGEQRLAAKAWHQCEMIGQTVIDSAIGPFGITPFPAAVVEHQQRVGPAGVIISGKAQGGEVPVAVEPVADDVHPVVVIAQAVFQPPALYRPRNHL